MAIIDKVKLALRISTSALDAEITDQIKAAKEELIRAGVPATVVSSEGDLVVLAVKTFTLANMCDDDKDATRYEESFRYQMDNLRKTDWGVQS